MSLAGTRDSFNRHWSLFGIWRYSLARQLLVGEFQRWRLTGATVIRPL